MIYDTALAMGTIPYLSTAHSRNDWPPSLCCLIFQQCAWYFLWKLNMFCRKLHSAEKYLWAGSKSSVDMPSKYYSTRKERGRLVVILSFTKQYDHQTSIKILEVLCTCFEQDTQSCALATFSIYKHKTSRVSKAFSRWDDVAGMRWLNMWLDGTGTQLHC